MSIVRVEEEIQPLKYLVVTQQKDPDSVITTNIVISDNRVNRISLISIEKGYRGEQGLTGLQGVAGQDGVLFDVLPVSSGGTNNTTFTSGTIIYYDGNKLSSTDYTLEDMLNVSLNANAVTGVFAGSGISRDLSGNSVTLNANVGEGLLVNEDNQISVDSTIVRRVELNLGSIEGTVPISKGGTNNQTFNSNKLIYFDGTKIATFPLATGRILLSGTTIDIVAGSGLIGGGTVNLPNGSVVLNIGSSSDILVENNSISLSTTGTEGTYNSVTTDSKGRVIAGSNLTSTDIINILGYTPWSSSNDGIDSGLDADLLDGLHGDYYLNAQNLTGTIDLNSIPSSIEPGVFTKVYVNDKGMVSLGDNMNYFDVAYSLGYRPVSTTGDTIAGNLIVNGNVNLNSDELLIRDNLPMLGTNSASILPSEPRGFSFIYGGSTYRTGLLAYYPGDRELKLITNITSSSSNINGGDPSDSFMDDIDGGNENSIYSLSNLAGDTNVVLLRSVGDNSYVSRTANQVISGSKTFVTSLTVNDQVIVRPVLGQTTGPFDVSSNINLVESLNADLLDDNHGTYYTDASNMTGLFTYEKVNFDHIQGTIGRIPVFDSRTNNPSQTISDSFIRQTGNMIQITDDAHLTVGIANTGSNIANRSLLVGSRNYIHSNNSLAVGSNNIVSGDNSVALNVGSKAIKSTSIAAGNHGYTWANNQFSFGGFEETTDGQTTAQGQYSTVAMYLNGTQTDGGEITMSPTIIIPKNKTIGYNLQVLMHKSAGTGAAMFTFESGIIKNSTFRDPNNITITKNITSVLKDSTKKEIYNDSQQRIHYHAYQLADDRFMQNIEVTAKPLKLFSEISQNVSSLYKYTPEFLTLEGSYSKTNDGHLVFDLKKPQSSGWFFQPSGTNQIHVKSYKHSMVVGSMARLNFTSGSLHKPISRQYEVISVLDQNNFLVKENPWRGVLTNNTITLESQDIIDIDEANIIVASGNIYTGGNTLSNISHNINGILHSGMLVLYGPDTTLFPESLIQTGIITNCNNSVITFSPAFTGTYNNSTISSPGFCKLAKYSKYIFDSSKTVFTDILTYGTQPASSLSGAQQITYCGAPSLSMQVSGLTAVFSGQNIQVYPASFNSGTLSVIPHRNVSGEYARNATTFKRYDGVYTQYPSVSGKSEISIYSKQLSDINLPSVPFNYSLVCGYGDNDNDLFTIYNSGLYDYLMFKKDNPITISRSDEMSDCGICRSSWVYDIGQPFGGGIISGHAVASGHTSNAIWSGLSIGHCVSGHSVIIDTQETISNNISFIVDESISLYSEPAFSMDSKYSGVYTISNTGSYEDPTSECHLPLWSIYVSTYGASVGFTGPPGGISVSGLTSGALRISTGDACTLGCPEQWTFNNISGTITSRELLSGEGDGNATEFLIGERVRIDLPSPWDGVFSNYPGTYSLSGYTTIVDGSNTLGVITLDCDTTRQVLSLSCNATRFRTSGLNISDGDRFVFSPLIAQEVSCSSLLPSGFNYDRQYSVKYVKNIDNHSHFYFANSISEDPLYSPPPDSFSSYVMYKSFLDHDVKNKYRIRLKASDRSESRTFEKFFTININNTGIVTHLNHPIPDQYSVVENLFSYEIPDITFGENREDTAFSYSARLSNGNILPAWLSFNTGTKTFTGTPLSTSTGTIEIKVVATASELVISDNFLIHIDGNSISSQSYLNTTDPTFDITSIILSNTNVAENISYDTTVCKISALGGYLPYCIFSATSNNMTATMISGSPVLTECISTSGHYPTVDIVGNIPYLVSGCQLDSTSIGFPNNPTINKIVRPVSFSAIGHYGLNRLTFDENIYGTYTTNGLGFYGTVVSGLNEIVNIDANLSTLEKNMVIGTASDSFRNRAAFTGSIPFIYFTGYDMINGNNRITYSGDYIPSLFQHVRIYSTGIDWPANGVVIESGEYSVDHGYLHMETNFLYGAASAIEVTNNPRLGKMCISSWGYDINQLFGGGIISGNIVASGHTSDAIWSGLSIGNCLSGHSILIDTTGTIKNNIPFIAYEEISLYSEPTFSMDSKYSGVYAIRGTGFYEDQQTLSLYRDVETTLSSNEIDFTVIVDISGNATVSSIESGGHGHLVNDTFIVSGVSFGGFSPDDDMSFEITEVLQETPLGLYAKSHILLDAPSVFLDSARFDNSRVYFNGNIIEYNRTTINNDFNYPHQIFSTGDIVKILSYGSENINDDEEISRKIQVIAVSSDQLRMSGIAIEGPKNILPNNILCYDVSRGNQSRHSYPFGYSESEELQTSGTINIINESVIPLSSSIFSGTRILSTGLGWNNNSRTQNIDYTQLNLNTIFVGIPGGDYPKAITGVINIGSHLISITGVNVSLSSVMSGNAIYGEGFDSGYTLITAIGPSALYVDKVSTVSSVSGLLTIYSGLQRPIQLTAYTNGYSLILNNSSSLTNTNIIASHSSVSPLSGNYYVNTLQTFNPVSIEGWCPTEVSSVATKGFWTESLQYSSTTGYYATGLVSFYTDEGHSIIDILPDEYINIESNEDSIYLDFLNHNHSPRPIDGYYSVISGYDGHSSFQIDNTFLFPDSAIYTTGRALINLDRNHGYKIFDNNKILNQIPIEFNTVELSNSNRKPKNNLFDILAITGNKITVNDSKNYLLKEYNKPSYFEQAINGHYTTNGFNFSGTVFDRYNRIFNINKPNISSLLKINNIFNVSSASQHTLPLIVERIDNPFSLSTTITPGYNVVHYCGSSLWNTQIFSGVNLYAGFDNNSSNYKNCASWDTLAGNLTDVGTNGGPSSYGTFDQVGNISQWNDLTGNASSVRGVRGGAWNSNSLNLSSSYRREIDPSFDTNEPIGFRIASLQDPSFLDNSQFVTVSDLNNSADNNGYGSVSYSYSIGKYVIINTEYTEFLNAVAAKDDYGVYDTLMAGDRGGINRSGISGSYTYAVKTNYGNKPVNYISWFNAARYCNWLHNNRPNGYQNRTTTEAGSYELNGTISGDAFAKNANAKYHIPTENEWYKAAYYKGSGISSGYWSYATQNNSEPTCVNASIYGSGYNELTHISKLIRSLGETSVGHIENLYSLDSISLTGNKMEPVLASYDFTSNNIVYSGNNSTKNYIVRGCNSGSIELSGYCYFYFVSGMNYPKEHTFPPLVEFDPIRTAYETQCMTPGKATISIRNNYTSSVKFDTDSLLAAGIREYHCATGSGGPAPYPISNDPSSFLGLFNTMKIPVSISCPVYPRDFLEIKATSGYIRNVSPYLDGSNQIQYQTTDYPIYCYWELYDIQTQNIVPDKSLILDLALVNPTNENLTRTYVTTGNVKPKIFINDLICLGTQNSKQNNRYFYNGDTIYVDNLSTPRSYLNINDQLKIIAYNGANIENYESGISRNIKITETNLRDTAFSGVVMNGDNNVILDLNSPDWYKQRRHSNPLGLSLVQELPISGTLSFVGSVSGYCTVPFNNNIYYHSYGSSTSQWPIDSDGKLVLSPQTGIYTVVTSNQGCSSGSMCIRITGFKNTSFNNIQDVVNRSLVGQTTNLAPSENSSGYVRPWGLNKKLFLDFSDDMPELHTSYYIVDKLNPQTITVTIPYNDNYLNRSGLVYIVDSNYDIKANRNPNLNNQFITSQGVVSIAGSQGNLVDYYIDSYDDQSKRWKHLVHFNKNINSFSGYPTTVHSQDLTQLISIQPDSIRINELLYSLDNGLSYSSLLEDETITILSSQTSVYIRLHIVDGSGKWDASLQKAAPKINIFGIGSYFIDTGTIIFDIITKTWTINIFIDSLEEFVSEKPIVITASDESGSDDFNFNLTTFVLPVIPSIDPVYVYQNSIINWKLPYDIKYLSNDVTISVTGDPGSSASIINSNLLNSSNTKIITGLPGSNTGIFYPTIVIRDLLSSQILAQQSSVLTVLSVAESIPEYVLSPQGLETNINLDITDSIDESASFIFFIPYIDDEITPIVSFETDENYSITNGNILIEPDLSSNRYRVTVTVVGSVGFYQNKFVTISISQPIIGENEQVEYKAYNYYSEININIYKRLHIDKSEVIEPISTDITAPWSLQFRIRDGIGSNQEGLIPRIRLSHLPNAGNYENQPIEYTTSITYDEITHSRQVFVVGKADVFGKYTNIIGPHTIQIYAEDSISSDTASISMIFIKTPYLDNIQRTIYATANNPYQTIIDIKQPSSDLTSVPNVLYPSQLKENTVSIHKYYNKYDSYFDSWVFAYSGDPSYDKWDTFINVTNTNNVLTNNQYSEFQVSCKGIATDQVYGIAKLDLIELDTNILPGIPLEIINIQRPYYAAEEGSKWEISFSTIGGLENPNYPPNIFLSGLPSACSGFNPYLPIEEQAQCFSFKVWNPSLKQWNFAFSGLPLCGIQGIKPFHITAVDTDTVQHLYLGVATADAEILYESLEEAGIIHPKPKIVTVPGNASSDVETIALTPSCNTPIDKTFRFGSSVRATCPIPTGITGWIITGSVPSGLNYSISFPGGNPQPPWNNLGSGTLRIFGNPTHFANGGAYAESLRFTVFDARNKSGVKTINFSDSSFANPPSPINLTVYFDHVEPVYTSRFIDPQRDPYFYPSGSLQIDGPTTRQFKTAWPPANAIALECTSRLPHSNCQTSTFSYSGDNENTKVYINNTRINLNTDDILYVEFDEDGYNGVYPVSVQPNQAQARYINIIGHNLITGTGRFVKSAQPYFTTTNLQKFNGTVDINTSSPLMGCGSYKVIESFKPNPGGYGIFGRISPSYIATIPTSGSFDNTDIFFTGLNVGLIPDSYPSIFTVKTSNCWETGYIRISGISVPSPSIELTDPPPAIDAPFAYNNQAYAVLSRCVYGNSQQEKNIPANSRPVTANYVIRNITQNTQYSAGSISTDSSILFNNTYSSGSVMSLFLSKASEQFPTYKYNAIPYAENEYFWIHKAGNRDDTPTQASFPPIIMTGIKNSISCISGVPISGYTIQAIGGYVPFVGVSPSVPYYSLPDSSVWQLSDYTPFFTGILQESLNKAPTVGTYSHPGGNSVVTIQLPPGYFSAEDMAYLTFEGSILPNTGITLPNPYNNILTIPLNRANTVINGSVSIYSKSMIDDIGSNYITIKHNNVAYGIGDKIDVTQNTVISTQKNIAPNQYNLSISSGDSRYIYASFDGPSIYPFATGLVVSGLCDIKKNHYDQININNISYIPNAKWTFSLSGTPTGLYKDYNYKLISVENTGLPAFSGTSLSAKKYMVEYPLYINKPIQILLSDGIGIMKSNGNSSWSLNFQIEGGSRPVYDYVPEIMLNDSICNFTRSLNNIKMNDSYDIVNDRLDITLSSANSSNYNWTSIGAMELKVFDKTGSDTKTIYLNEP